MAAMKIEKAMAAAGVAEKQWRVSVRSALLPK